MRRIAQLRPSAVAVAMLAALLAIGGIGIRSIHLAVAHAGPGFGCSTQACAHGDACAPTVPLAPAPADGQDDCDTCAAIEGMAVDAVRVTPAPTVHALVAVVNDRCPPAMASPAPPLVVSARPPPTG